MATDDTITFVDDDGNIEPEIIDALFELPNLLGLVQARILWIRL